MRNTEFFIFKMRVCKKKTFFQKKKTTKENQIKENHQKRHIQ